MPAGAEGNTHSDVCVLDDLMENVVLGRGRSSHSVPTFCPGTWAPLQKTVHGSLILPSSPTSREQEEHCSARPLPAVPSAPCSVSWLLPITQRDPLKLEVTFQNCTSHPNPSPVLDFTNLISLKCRADIPASRAGEEHSHCLWFSAWPLLNKRPLALVSPLIAFRFSPGNSFPHFVLSEALLSLHLWILSKAGSFPFSGWAVAIQHLGRESRLYTLKMG